MTPNAPQRGTPYPSLKSTKYHADHTADDYTLSISQMRINLLIMIYHIPVHGAARVTWGLWLGTGLWGGVYACFRSPRMPNRHQGKPSAPAPSPEVGVGLDSGLDSG